MMDREVAGDDDDSIVDEFLNVVDNDDDNDEPCTLSLEEIVEEDTMILVSPQKFSSSSWKLDIIHLTRAQ